VKSIELPAPSSSSLPTPDLKQRFSFRSQTASPSPEDHKRGTEGRTFVNSLPLPDPSIVSPPLPLSTLLDVQLCVLLRLELVVSLLLGYHIEKCNLERSDRGKGGAEAKRNGQLERERKGRSEGETKEEIAPVVRVGDSEQRQTEKEIYNEFLVSIRRR